MRRHRCYVNSPRPARSLALALVVVLLSVGSPTGAPALSPLWTKTVDGSAHRFDEGSDVADGWDGTFYVAGYTRASGQDNNAWLRKYSNGGPTQWTRRYNGPGNLDDRYTSVARAPGSVVVAGYTTVAGQKSNILVRQYSTFGEIQWTATYAGKGDSFDWAQDVAAAPDGSVYVIGSTETASRGYNIWLRKYTSLGEVVWTRKINGAANGDDWGAAVAVAPDGGVYAAGTVFGGSSGSDIWLRKYTPGGDVSWTYQYAGGVGSNDYITGVAVGPDGSVVLSGHRVVGDTTDILLVKVTSFGWGVWMKSFDFYGSYDYGEDVAVSLDGSIYLAASTAHPSSGYDILVLKFDSAGTMVSGVQTDGGTGSFDVGKGIALLPSGDVALSGTATAGSTRGDIFVGVYTE